MTKTSHRPIATALAALCVAAAPAVARAESPKPVFPKLATFDVQLEGVQKSSWEYRHTQQHGCDSNAHDYGRESYRFRSRKLRVQAQLHDGRVFFTTERGPATLSVRGTVKREAELNHSSIQDCAIGGAGVGGEQPQPDLDCGARRVKQKVTLDYSALYEDFVVIDDGLWDARSPFANCPTGGYAFPRLLTQDSEGEQIGQKLPAEDLFRHGKSIVIARGVNRSPRPDAEQWHYASIRWTASFTRVRGR
jgi:hypothetical protein